MRRTWNDAASRIGDYPHFRRTWNQVVVALLAAAFLPLFLLGGGMYFYAARMVENDARERLVNEAQSHRRYVDAFLAERENDLRVVAGSLSREDLVRPGVLPRILDSLRSREPYFSDLGVVSLAGEHLAYQGPHDLLGKNYREADWFQQVIQRGACVSDVFLGFRGEPHIVVAVRQGEGAGGFILRATLNAAVFHQVAGSFGGDRQVTVFLLNRQGAYQNQPPEGARLMDPSGIPVPERFAGAQLWEEGDHLRVAAWLDRVSWLCVAQAARREVLAPLRALRLVALGVLALGGLVILVTVLITTDHLVTRLEYKRQSLDRMDRKLRQANRLGISSEEMRRFLDELREALTNMDAAAQWQRELAGREPGRPEMARELGQSAEQIRGQVTRGLRALDRLIPALNLPRPQVREVDLTQLLGRILETLGGELAAKGVEVSIRHEHRPLALRSDPALLRQVFQNILHNAVLVLGTEGNLIIESRRQGDRAVVAISDDGPGIPPERLAGIFDSDPDRQGLGLAVSKRILDRLGGSVTVDSRVGEGATFVVMLPLAFSPAA